MTPAGLRLKGGHGYWQTDLFPIGGAFRRAPAEGKEIVAVLRSFHPYKGVDTEVHFADGTRGAVNKTAIEGGVNE